MPESCGWSIPLEVIEAWVVANRDNLPKNLAELSLLPMDFRRVIVNIVPHDVRTTMWIEHLRNVLDTETRLSVEQRAFIEETIRELPAVLAPGAPRELFEDFSKRSSKMFEAALGREIFQRLGPAEPPEGLPMPLLAVV